jgi:pimeloyl-ACP methyl ester carboxylesterase
MNNRTNCRSAFVADCPFSSPGAIIRKVSRDIRLPQWLSYPFVVLGALVFGRFRIWQSSALKSVQNTRIPILLIHGEDDLFVPCNMSREIYAACAGPAELVVVPEAGHGLSYFTDTALYTSSMEDFLRLFGVLS